MIYLKILSRLGYFICVSPKYDFKTANISISKWHDLYAIFTTISAIIICILIFATNPIYRIPNIQITGKLLHIGYCACITGAMASALLTPLLQSKTWKKLLNNIQTLERIFFGMNVSHGQTYKHVSWKLFFLYLTIFVKDTYVIVCTWMKTPELYKYLLYTELYKYYTYTPLIIYIRINSIMKDKYKFIGCLLEKSTLQYISSTKNKIATIDFRQNKNVFRLKVKLMKRAYKTLNDTVNAHNSIFGFQIFFTVGYTFLRNLERFSGSLSVKRKENTTIFNQHDRPSYFWATQIAALSNVIISCAVIISADVVKREAKRLLDICHKLEGYLEETSFEDKQEFSKFVKFVHAKIPQFSAAGFFNIDRTTLFSMLSVSTTYYVALVQYNQSNLEL